MNYDRCSSSKYQHCCLQARATSSSNKRGESAANETPPSLGLEEVVRWEQASDRDHNPQLKAKAQNWKCITL